MTGGQPRPERPRPAGPGDRRPPARRRPPPRRRVTVPLAVLLAAVALAAGVVVGWVSRGEPAPPGLVTQERQVPVVTLTVEVPQAPR